MEKYVYEHLKRYGNTVISEKVYDKMGEKKILKDLKRHGFDCEITVYKYKERDYIGKNVVIRTYRDIIVDIKKWGGLCYTKNILH